MDEKSLQIARMNAITQAREYLSCKTGCDFTAREWLQTSDLISEFIMKGQTEEVKNRTKKLDIYLEKVKNKKVK